MNVHNIHMMRVGIAGASGYAGGELIRLLSAHPKVSLGTLAAGTHAGKHLHQVHPALVTLADQMLVPTSAEVFADCDLVFLALPHGQSAALVRELGQHVRIVDLGADFRLGDASAWERFYGGTLAGTWTYGLPEIPGARTQIAQSTRVANPGCYPTSVALALVPLLINGLIEPDDIVVTSASGTSGAGRKATDALLGSEVMGSMSAYKVGGVHQHTPEMEQTLSRASGAEISLLFTPTLAPMSRGILSTCTAKRAKGVQAADIRQALMAAYQDEKFVHVLPEGQWPHTSSTYGANSVHIQSAVDDHTGRVVVVSALDNLVKGAAGQAVQNMNIMCGFAEDTALSAQGVAP